MYVSFLTAAILGKESINISYCLFFTHAGSKESAIKEAQEFVQEKYPSTQGYSNHNIYTVKVSDLDREKDGERLYIVGAAALELVDKTLLINNTVFEIYASNEEEAQKTAELAMEREFPGRQYCISISKVITDAELIRDVADKVVSKYVN